MPGPATGPTVHDMEVMQDRLAAAEERITHLNKELTAAEAASDRHRERADQGSLARVALAEIAGLLDTATDGELRTAIAAVVATARTEATAVSGQCGACWACRSSNLDDPMARAVRALLDWQPVAVRRPPVPADSDLLVAAYELLRSPTCLDPATSGPAAPSEDVEPAKEDPEPATTYHPAPAAVDVPATPVLRDRLLAAVRRAPRLSRHRPTA